jgi:nucleoside-triphosphatase THEP1
MQGSGKSTLVRRIMDALESKYERLVIFDLQDEYEWDVLATTARELREIIIDSEKRKEKIRIGVQITDFDEAERIAGVVFNAPNTLLIIDEAEVYIEKHTNARQSYFHKIISFGRHDNIGIVAVARRPVELNVYLRASRTTLITFRQNETPDLDRLERYGFSRNELEKLGKHDFLLLGDDILKTNSKEGKAT